MLGVEHRAEVPFAEPFVPDVRGEQALYVCDIRLVESLGVFDEAIAFIP